MVSAVSLGSFENQHWITISSCNLWKNCMFPLPGNRLRCVWSLPSEMAPWQRTRLAFGRYRVQIPVPTNLTEGFSWFSSIIKANAGLDFHYHYPFNHYSSNSYIIKLKSVNLRIETLTTQQWKYTDFWYTHTKTLDAIWPICWRFSK